MRIISRLWIITSICCTLTPLSALAEETSHLAEIDSMGVANQVRMIQSNQSKKMTSNKNRLQNIKGVPTIQLLDGIALKGWMETEQKPSSGNFHSMNTEPEQNKQLMIGVTILW